MRYCAVALSVVVASACSTVLCSRAGAAPLVVAQAEGGGIGGSLGGSIAAPEARTVQAKPRVRRAAAPRAASAPRVIVERRVVYQPRYVERPRAEPRRRGASSGGNLAQYDGTWSVSAGGGCSAAGTSQVMISAGRIMGQNGGGHVTPDGTVNTVGSYNGLSIAAQGQMTAQSASGIYRQSDGCSGPWSGVKL